MNVHQLLWPMTETFYKSMDLCKALVFVALKKNFHKCKIMGGYREESEHSRIRPSLKSKVKSVGCKTDNNKIRWSIKSTEN